MLRTQIEAGISRQQSFLEIMCPSCFQMDGFGTR